MPTLAVGVGVDSVCCLLFWGRGDQTPSLFPSLHRNGHFPMFYPLPYQQKAQGLGTSLMPPQSVWALAGALAHILLSLSSHGFPHRFSVKFKLTPPPLLPQPPLWHPACQSLTLHLLRRPAECTCLTCAHVSQEQALTSSSTIPLLPTLSCHCGHWVRPL